jgi:hypothetical protein
MPAVYPLHLEREISRRWLHRLLSINPSTSLDRPKHPNDIRPLPSRPSDVVDPLKSEPFESDRDKRKPSRSEQARRLMEL